MGIYIPVTPASIGAVPITRDLVPGTNVTLNGGNVPVALSNDITIAASGGGGGLTSLPVDQNGTLIVNATSMNFTGAGVSVTNTGAQANVAIAGGGGAMALLATITAAGGETAFDFTPISGAYKHLRLIGQARSSAAPDNMVVQINALTSIYQTTIYFQDQANPNVSSSYTGTDGLSLGNVAGNTSPANTTASFDILFPEYSGTTYYKDMISHCRYNGSTTKTIMQAYGTANLTAAISELRIHAQGNGAFAAGSSFSLYGIT